MRRPARHYPPQLRPPTRRSDNKIQPIMLNQIIAFSLRNRPMVLFFSVLLLGIGTWTAWRMEVDVFPDLNAPTVVVMTEATGMAPKRSNSS